MQGDILKVRTAILVGVAVPLAMFLCWDAAILGSLGGGGLAPGADPLAALRGTGGLAPLIDSFSLLAIATSYIGFVLGLTDFIADYLEVRLWAGASSDRCESARRLYLGGSGACCRIYCMIAL